jgi:hypothetical protein
LIDGHARLLSGNIAASQSDTIIQESARVASAADDLVGHIEWLPRQAMHDIAIAILLYRAKTVVCKVGVECPFVSFTESTDGARQKSPLPLP